MNDSLQNPVDEAQVLYTKRVALYHRFFMDILRYHQALAAFFRKSSYMRQGIRVLDAGCGSGVVTKSLYDIANIKGFQGVTFYAFDLTEAMLNLFRQWVVENEDGNIELAQADVLQPGQIPKHWKDYPLTVSSAMLEHLPKTEIKNALCNLRQLMEENGTIVIIITKRNFIMEWLIHRWWKANMYERDEIRGLFDEVGFSSVKFRSFPFPYSHFKLWGFIIEAKK
jgi:SAM-dependent methyltransferase